MFVLRSTQNTNTLCGQKVELLNVKVVGTYSDHCAVHIVTTGLYRVNLGAFSQKKSSVDLVNKANLVHSFS